MPRASYFGMIRGGEAAGHGSLPAGPPLGAEILQVICLAAGLPIDVDRAQGFGAEYAGIEAAGRIGEKEDRVRGSGGARPRGKLRQLRRVQAGIADDSPQCGNREECQHGRHRRETRRAPDRQSRQSGERHSQKYAVPCKRLKRYQVG